MAISPFPRVLTQFLIPRAGQGGLLLSSTHAFVCEIGCFVFLALVFGVIGTNYSRTQSLWKL